MTQDKPNLEAVLSALGAEQCPTSHPTDEALVDYSMGTLPDPLIPALQDHLAHCPECTQQLLALVDFPETVPDQFEVPPNQMERAIQQFVGSDDQALARQPVDPTSVVVSMKRYRILQLAASFFLVTSLGLGVALLQRSGAKPQRPEANIPIIDRLPVDPGERGTAPDPVLSFPSNRGIVLILNPPQHESFSNYRISIHGKDDSLLWQAEGFKPTDYGNFTLGLPPSFLKPGRYDIKLFGLSPDRQLLLAVYPDMTITPSEGD